MGIELDTLYLYRITVPIAVDRHLLLRIKRPGYNNAIQSQENEAYDIQEKRRIETFIYYISQYLNIEDSSFVSELIAESDELALGEELYVDEIIPEINIYTAHTSYGDPWRIFGTASDKSSFKSQAIEEYLDDTHYDSLEPIESYAVMFIPDVAVLYETNKNSDKD